MPFLLKETCRLIKHAQLRKYYKIKASKQEGSILEPEKVTTDAREIIKIAIENARPLMQIEKVLVGSIQYQVPTPITMRRSEYEGM